MPKATARHILVDTEEKCQNLKTEIEGGADFGEVAAAHSTCPSGKSGGDLGSFEAGRMVPAFEKAVKSVKAGEIVGPVETDFGFHIIMRTK